MDLLEEKNTRETIIMKSKAIKNFLHGEDSLVITRTRNGFLLCDVQFQEDGEINCDSYSYEEGENQDYIISLLYEIIDHLGITTSKHDKLRLRIGFEAQNVSIEEARNMTEYTLIREDPNV